MLEVFHKHGSNIHHVACIFHANRHATVSRSFMTIHSRETLIYSHVQNVELILYKEHRGQQKGSSIPRPSNTGESGEKRAVQRGPSGFGGSEAPNGGLSKPSSKRFWV